MDVGPRVICGFPGVGKTTLFQMLKEKGFPIVDSDSSQFDKKFFPQNYIEHIKQQLANNQWVLCSTHKEVRIALQAAGIGYAIACPAYRHLKDEYIQRYIKRGSPEAFVKLMEFKWDEFFDDVTNDSYGLHIGLGGGEFLERIAKDLIKRDAGMKAVEFKIGSNNKILGVTIGEPNHSVEYLNGFMAGRIEQDLTQAVKESNFTEHRYLVRADNQAVMRELAAGLGFDLVISTTFNPQAVFVDFTLKKEAV